MISGSGVTDTSYLAARWIASYLVLDLALAQDFAETVEEQDKGIGSPLGGCSGVNGSLGYIFVEELLLDRLDGSDQRAAQIAVEFCGSLDHAGPLLPVELEECFQQNVGRLPGNGFPIHHLTLDVACDRKILFDLMVDQRRIELLTSPVRGVRSTN